MDFELKKVVPWGRSLQEYIHFFNLRPADLDKNIVGVGDGPASVNAELAASGKNYISVDPVYCFAVEQIRLRILETTELIKKETKQNKDNFYWNYYKNEEQLFVLRKQAMDTFLEDFKKGKAEERYIDASLPTLPFKNNSFDLALCSHFLFLYSNIHDRDFHLLALKELIRISKEVRVFPLLNLNAEKSEHLTFVMNELEKEGYKLVIEKVNYEFQKGGNEMLRIC